MVSKSDQRVAAEGPPEQGVEKPSQGALSFLTRIPTFRALAHRDFRYLWLGQMSNSAAVWTEQVARPILILQLTNSAVHLGLVLAVRTLPQLFFGLLAGVFADWFDRRRQMLLSKSLAMTIDFAFAALILTGRVEIWHVYLTTFLRGAALAFDQPARQSLVPNLVPGDTLANAVALNTASMNAMRIGGAAIAGTLLATAGTGGTFLAVAIMTTCAVYFTLMMRVPPMETVVKDKSSRAAASSFVEGARYAWENNAIRGVLILLVCYFGIAMAYMQVFAPLLATQAMGIGDGGFGLMMATIGVGALIGTLIVATLSPARRRGMTIIILMVTMGSLLALFAASTYLPNLALTFALIGLAGMAQSSITALGNTVLLQAAPPEKRGRIMGLMSLDRSMITLGGTIAGFLAAAIGAQLAQITFGVSLIAITILVAIMVPTLRRVQ